MTARRVEARLLKKDDVVLTSSGERMVLRQCVVGEERVALRLKGTSGQGVHFPFSVPVTCRFLREFGTVK